VARYRGFAQYMEHERGFRGWLVFFFVTSCLGAVVRAFSVYRSGVDLRVAITVASSTPVILLVIGQLVVRCSLLVATVYGLLLFARADARTPTFWAVLLFVSVAINLVVDVISAYQTMVFDHASFSLAFWSALQLGGLRSTAVTLIWALYWMRSTRVKLTFGVNAFEQLTPSLMNSHAPVT